MISRPSRGGEEGGVDTALHEVAGTVAHVLKEGAELGVGSEEDAGEAIEAGGGEEGEALDGFFDAGGVMGSQMAGEPAHAAGGVLVDVGVPGGGERDVVAPGEPGAEDAELAGTGDVEDVGTEGAEGSVDGAGVADEEGIEVEIFFKGDGGAGTWELEGVEVGRRGGGWGRAGADAEEGKAAALGEGGEVSAGVGDAVDFVEGVGKESDAGRAHGGLGTAGALKCRQLQRVDVVAEVRHLAVVQADEPDVAEIERRVVFGTSMMAGGFHDDFVTCFAHAEIAHRSEVDEVWKVAHVVCDGGTTFQPAGSSLWREGELVDGVWRVDLHPAVGVFSLEGLDGARQPWGERGCWGHMASLGRTV